MNESRVYIVKAVQRDGSAILKIGVSSDVERRLKGLQSGYPFSLTMLGNWPGGLRTEAALHRHFAEFRLNGEWFELCDRSQVLLDAVLDNGVDDIDPAPIDMAARRFSSDVLPLFEDDAPDGPLPSYAFDILALASHLRVLTERVEVLERRLSDRSRP